MLLIFFFFVVALLYASIGFGGGSSYLALLSIQGSEFYAMKSAALLCNLVVVSQGTFLFWKEGALPWKKVAPLALISVPLAFLGGYLRLSSELFMFILGCSLVASALLMFGQLAQKDKRELASAEKPLPFHLLIGGSTGFLAGLVGIGGGIFLSPLLHLIRWGTAREIAAASSFFILVNSLAGIGGLLANNRLSIEAEFIFPLLLAVLVGGQIGSRLGSQLAPQWAIRGGTALLVLYAGGRILLT